MKKYWPLISVTLIVSAGLAFQLVGAWQDSQTTDEGNHLAGGVIYLQTDNFSWNPAHPPLVKLLAGLPLVIGHQVKADPAIVANHSINIREFFGKLFYDQAGLLRPQRLFFWGRLPMLLFWLLLGGLLFWWSKKRWGIGAGILALAVFIFDPNFLGHGHLINTDVPISALMFATILAADRYFNHPGRVNLLLLALFFGLSQITKFSAVYLWPIIFGLGLIKIWLSQKKYSWRSWWKMVGVITIVTGFVIWASYGFEVRRFFPKEITSSKVAAVTDRFPLPIPAASYFKGLSDVFIHNKVGHETYLNGRFSTGGWWYYFPEAIILKTPILTLFLFGLWLAVGLVKTNRSVRQTGWRWPSFSIWLFGLPPLLYLVISMTSNINIGLRHIFPIYPFIFLAIGSLTNWSAFKKLRHRGLIIAAMVLISAGVAWRAWPNTISYFNTLAGGSVNGQKYLMDSNLDWGQDVWRLQRFLDRQKFGQVRVWVYGSIPAVSIWPAKLPMLFDKNIAAGAVPDGIIVTSKDNLYDPNGRIKYLLPYQPRWQIGSTILVYDFRK